MDAQDIKTSAYRTSAVDAAILAGARAVEGLTHRVFYPWTGTRTLDWPAYPDPARTFRVWLEQNELISLSAIVSGGTTMTAASFLLYPTDGPPYTRIEAPRSSTSAYFQRGTNSGQQALSLTGVFGFRADESAASTLAEDLDASETSIDVNALVKVGVGTILRVDTERMLVTEKAWISSTQTVQTPLTASSANTTVAVTTGSVFAAGETILVDSERMHVVDVAGNNLTVRRAADGSVLAVHAGSTIYWPRTLIVERGALGTTAAVHSTSAVVYRHIVPSLVEQLNRAYAIASLLGEESGYARTYRPGDETDRVTYARGVSILEQQVKDRYARNARTRAV